LGESDWQSMTNTPDYYNTELNYSSKYFYNIDSAGPNVTKNYDRNL